MAKQLEEAKKKKKDEEEKKIRFEEQQRNERVQRSSQFAEPGRLPFPRKLLEKKR